MSGTGRGVSLCGSSPGRLTQPPALQRAVQCEGSRCLVDHGRNSAHGGDGRVHTLDVEVVGRRGLRVRHRRSYRDKTPETRLIEGVLAALHHGGGVNPLGARLEVTTMVVLVGAGDAGSPAGASSGVGASSDYATCP